MFLLGGENINYNVKMSLFLLNIRSGMIIIIIYHAQIKVSVQIISTFLSG